MYRTQANSKEYKKNHEVPDGTVLVERAGYVPTKVRIEEFIQAGIRLKEHRMQQYDYPDGEIDENESPNPARKGLDLAEASEILNAFDGKLENAKNESKKKRESKSVSEDKPATESTSEPVKPDQEPTEPNQ